MATKKMGSSKKICFGVFVAIGLVMIIVGGTILGVFPGIVEKKVQQELPIYPSTDASERFIISPVTNYMAFYVFNVKNKDEVNNGSKAELEEKGPYVYRQEKIKYDLKWDPVDGTLTYLEKTQYFFESSMTTGSLDDMINHIHIFPIGIRYNPLASSAYALCGKDNLDHFIEDIDSPLIISHTVNELLFAGYNAFDDLPNTPCMNALKVFCGFSFADCLTVGYFNDRNNTDSKVYQIYTGAKGMDNFAEIVTYDHKNQTDYWYGPSCNAINGTDGKQFPPGLNKEKEVYVFSTDICRSMKLVYKKDITVRKIDALRYTVPEIMFEDPNIYSDNMCFCQDPSEKNACPSKKGVFPIFKCQKYKPIAVSSPHFYFGEEAYKNAVGGMNPQEEKHETFLDIEPLTGTVIAGAKRLQMNLILEKYDHLVMLKNITELTYFPLLWLQEGATIDEESAKEFRDKVTNPYKSGKWGSVAVLTLGCVILLLVIVVAVFKGCKKG